MNPKGEQYAVDNLCGLDSAVVVGRCYGVYHGRSDSYFARDRYYPGAGKRYFRTKDRLKWEPVSEIF
jgi:hypothetical protein